MAHRHYKYMYLAPCIVIHVFQPLGTIGHRHFPSIIHLEPGTNNAERWENVTSPGNVLKTSLSRQFVSVQGNCLLTVHHTKCQKTSVQHWSSEETSVLLVIWSSSEIQEKLESSKSKKSVYGEISQEMQNGGFSRSTDQIINKLKKLRKEYRDQKRQ